MNKNTCKKTSLIILIALISASILFATYSCSTPTKATYPLTLPITMDAKTDISNIMYIKNDIFLYNATSNIFNIYTCQLDQDNYTEAIVISQEQTNISGTIYYNYNLTVIKLGSTSPVQWSKNITPPTSGWLPSFTLHLLNISDFDGDKENEIAIAFYYYGGGGGYYNLSVYDGDGSLLKDLSKFWQDCNYEKLVVVDWNSDGVNDILSVYWASNNFNVTIVKNVISGDTESYLYSYSASSCNIYQLVAGDFNTSSSRPELALSCKTDNYKILIIGDNIEQCFENRSTPYSYYYLYSTGEHLIFGTYYYDSGNIITLGAYRNNVLWSLTQNISGASCQCMVADVDLDYEPEIFYYYPEPTGRTYYTQYKYVVLEIGNGQNTTKNYVPVAVSLENDWKLLAQMWYGQYSTISTFESLPSSYSYTMISGSRFMDSSHNLVVLDRNYMSVSAFFPRFNSSSVYRLMLCFADYDGDGRLETLGVGSSSVALLELESVQLLPINVVYLVVYTLFSVHQSVNNGYFYLSVSLLVTVVVLTMFYYIRRRTMALEFDRQIRTK